MTLAVRDLKDQIVKHFRGTAEQRILVAREMGRRSVELFRAPQSVPLTHLGFTEQEARALTLFVLTLGETDIMGYLKIPALMSPVERGRAVYKKYGCGGCHGPEGQGGVRNPNAKTGEQVPGLRYVAEGYTEQELKKLILGGQPEIAALDPARPAPPLYMPAWRGKIDDREIVDLDAYLRSLFPEEEAVEF